MSTHVIQPELFIKYLPEDLVRYTYSFIYQDVKVNIWRHKYDMYDMLNVFSYYWNEYLFVENIVKMFTQHFPDDLHRITRHFTLESDKEKGRRWTYWYEMPSQPDDAYYDELFNDIIAIVNEKTPTEVYELLAGWVIIYNKILADSTVTVGFL